MTVAFIYAVEGETYALVRGPGVGGWFRSRGIPAMRSNVHNGYWLRQERIADVTALMELDGINAAFSDHKAPRYVPPPLIKESEVAA